MLEMTYVVHTLAGTLFSLFLFFLSCPRSFCASTPNPGSPNIGGTVIVGKDRCTVSTDGGGT